jgi:hypothetical protein
MNGEVTGAGLAAGISHLPFTKTDKMPNRGQYRWINWIAIIELYRLQIATSVFAANFGFDTND